MKLSKFQRDILKAALDYYDRGFCPLPIPLGSKGFGPKWKQYEKERPSREQVEAWFSDGRGHNLRIICGPVSGNFIALDYDDEPSYQKLLMRNPGIEQKTPVVRSGRIEPSPGHHVWLRSKEPIYTKGIPEVRGEGKYVLAPPSIHPISGNAYYFINPLIREPMVISNLNEIGIEVNPKPRVAMFSKHLIISPETVRPRYAREAVSEGERNSRAFKVSLHFFRHYRRDAAGKRIIAWAHQFCENFPDDSFTLRALEATMESAYKTLTGGK